jgi:membrane-associated HD superfamily phosphohydrolase
MILLTKNYTFDIAVRRPWFGTEMISYIPIFFFLLACSLSSITAAKEKHEMRENMNWRIQILMRICDTERDQFPNTEEQAKETKEDTNTHPKAMPMESENTNRHQVPNTEEQAKETKEDTNTHPKATYRDQVPNTEEQAKETKEDTNTDLGHPVNNIDLYLERIAKKTERELAKIKEVLMQRIEETGDLITEKLLPFAFSSMDNIIVVAKDLHTIFQISILIFLLYAMSRLRYLRLDNGNDLFATCVCFLIRFMELAILFQALFMLASIFCQNVIQTPLLFFGSAIMGLIIVLCNFVYLGLRERGPGRRPYIPPQV